MRKTLFLALALLASAVLSASQVLLDNPGDFKLREKNVAFGKLDWQKLPSLDGRKVDTMVWSVDYPVPAVEADCMLEMTNKIPGSLTALEMEVSGYGGVKTYQLKFTAGRPLSRTKPAPVYYIPMVVSGSGKHKFEFKVPEDWKYPVVFNGIIVSNKDNLEAESSKIEISGLRLTLDVGKVPNKKDLYSFAAASNKPTELFGKGEEVVVDLRLLNFSDDSALARLEAKMTDPKGQSVPLEIKSSDKQIRIKPELFGSYRIDYVLEFTDGTKLEKHNRFAVVPEPLRLNPQEKLASPWGLNMHGAQFRDLNQYEQLGLVWMRDYGYTYNWLQSAATPDGLYRRWPDFKKIDDLAMQTGMMFMPCFQRALSVPIAVEKKAVPDKDWLKHVIALAKVYPQYPAWEVDNEYDLRNGKSEDADNWASYKAYHKAFGRAFREAGFTNALLVEQGNAGIQVERTRDVVMSGALDDFDVINGHFYSGTSAPEISTGNRNAHGEFVASAQTVLLYDNLRNYKKAASCDGKQRQAWITEFGWDTLGGHVVSEEAQAAYLQRGFLTCLWAGIDKLFWFYNNDSGPQNSYVFFDGCGLYDGQLDPKPSAAAMAFLANSLINPKVLGNFIPAENAWGFVVEDRGRLSALVYQLDVEKTAPELELNSGDLFDMFGNPLPHGKHKLGIAPIWIKNLDKSSPYFIQAMFGMDSDYMPAMTAGDDMEFVFRADNRLDKELALEYGVELPANWKCSRDKGALYLKVGESGTSSFVVEAPFDAAPGLYTVKVRAKGEGAEKVIDINVMLSKPALLEVKPFTGEPEVLKLELAFLNNSAKDADFTVEPVLPKGWSSDPAKLELKNVPANTIVSRRLDVKWSDQWGEGESAMLNIRNSRGEPVGSVTLPPPRVTLVPVKDIKLDGDLSDWPAGAKFPSWMLGSTRLNPPVEVYMGYDKDYLYYAVKVMDSKVVCYSPASFWNQDCMEFFLDASGERKSGETHLDGQSQFWFVPSKEGGINGGRWMPQPTEAVTSGVTKLIDGGYIMEARIPVAAMNGMKLEPGRIIGLNWVLSAYGKDGKYEVYWKTVKHAALVPNQPRWGAARLGE